MKGLLYSQCSFLGMKSIVRTCLFLLVLVIGIFWGGSFGCSPLGICTGELGELSIDPKDSTCERKCDCNNQLYRGACIKGKCISTKREPCSDPSGIRPCVSVTGSCSGVQQCQPKGLRGRFWGNCVCKGASPKEPSAEQGSNDGGESGASEQPEVEKNPESREAPEKPVRPELPQVECRSGQNRPCYTGKPEATRGTGECKAGIQKCIGGKWDKFCVGEVKPSTELCDNKDNDCNGSIDDIPELGKPCSHATKFGICKDGKWTCQGNSKVCKVIHQPTIRQCNGKDNDCDGQIDEGLTRPCYTGTSTTKGVGLCGEGKETCIAGKWSGKCIGESLPKKDLCNGKDDDCDGQTDEDFKVGQSCSLGEGSCKAVGKWVCNKGQTGVVCNAKVGQPTKEVCDNQDNDCDGKIDEELSRSCYTGSASTRKVGLCKEGKETCSAGKWSGKCIGESLPAKEKCDGKDNDCDGKTDEDFDLDKSCSVGRGACARSGKKICKADFAGTECSVKPGSSTAEVCDGKDNDCDGTVDEGLPKCEICDGKDNDGDKLVDEDVAKCVYTLAGTGKKGFKDGAGSVAQFKDPTDITRVGHYLYITDRGNHRIRRIDLKTNQVSTLAGNGHATFQDGAALKSSFYSPLGLTAFDANTLMIASGVNNRIRKIDLTKNIVSTFVGSGIAGNGDGLGVAATFDIPSGIAWDGSRYLYVACQSAQTIRRIDTKNVNTVTTIAGAPAKQGYVDGVGAAARFRLPTGLALDGKGNLYVADRWNRRIRKIVLATGQVSTVAGNGQGGLKPGAALSASIGDVGGLAWGGNNTLYFTSLYAHVIWKLDTAKKVVSIVAGSGVGGLKDGPASTAQFHHPRGIHWDGKYIYVSHYFDPYIRRIKP